MKIGIFFVLLQKYQVVEICENNFNLGQTFYSKIVAKTKVLYFLHSLFQLQYLYFLSAILSFQNYTLMKF